jgi:hypothetical protein
MKSTLETGDLLAIFARIPVTYRRHRVRRIFKSKVDDWGGIRHSVRLGIPSRTAVCWRGVREGRVADVVIFDLETVTSRRRRCVKLQ